MFLDYKSGPNQNEGSCCTFIQKSTRLPSIPIRLPLLYPKQSVCLWLGDFPAQTSMAANKQIPLHRNRSEPRTRFSGPISVTLASPKIVGFPLPINLFAITAKSIWLRDSIILEALVVRALTLSWVSPDGSNCGRWRWIAVHVEYPYRRSKVGNHAGITTPLEVPPVPPVDTIRKDTCPGRARCGTRRGVCMPGTTWIRLTPPLAGNVCGFSAGLKRAAMAPGRPGPVRKGWRTDGRRGQRQTAMHKLSLRAIYVLDTASGTRSERGQRSTFIRKVDTITTGFRYSYHYAIPNNQSGPLVGGQLNPQLGTKMAAN